VKGTHLRIVVQPEFPPDDCVWFCKVCPEYGTGGITVWHEHYMSAHYEHRP
jgi:hypothetical protein